MSARLRDGLPFSIPRIARRMVTYSKGDVLGQGKPFDKEYRIVRHSDGVVRWVHGLGRLDFDGQGRPVNKCTAPSGTLPNASRPR